MSFIKTLLLAVQETNRACGQLVIKYPRNSFMFVPRSLVSKIDFSKSVRSGKAESPRLTLIPPLSRILQSSTS